MSFINKNKKKLSSCYIYIYISMLFVCFRPYCCVRLKVTRCAGTHQSFYVPIKFFFWVFYNYLDLNIQGGLNAY